MGKGGTARRLPAIAPVREVITAVSFPPGWEPTVELHQTVRGMWIQYRFKSDAFFHVLPLGPRPHLEFVFPQGRRFICGSALCLRKATCDHVQVLAALEDRGPGLSEQMRVLAQRVRVRVRADHIIDFAVPDHGTYRAFAIADGLVLTALVRPSPRSPLATSLVKDGCLSDGGACSMTFGGPACAAPSLLSARSFRGTLLGSAADDVIRAVAQGGLALTVPGVPRERGELGAGILRFRGDMLELVIGGRTVPHPLIDRRGKCWVDSGSTCGHTELHGALSRILTAEADQAAGRP